MATLDHGDLVDYGDPWQVKGQVDVIQLQISHTPLEVPHHGLNFTYKFIICYLNILMMGVLVVYTLFIDLVRYISYKNNKLLSIL